MNCLTIFFDFLKYAGVTEPCAVAFFHPVLYEVTGPGLVWLDRRPALNRSNMNSKKDQDS
ncbi:hypothetical protein [Gimesia alba]|uniref:hypothetical protein n=1 Tax=Gimesia alba TaxID=2527973 RepID=UPI0011A8705B|nr:hypothetical protein [Gimesia alba]